MSGDTKKIVLGVDGSEHSSRALNFFLDNVYQPGYEVILAHGMETPHIGYESVPTATFIDEIFGKIKRESEDILKKYAHILAEKQIPHKEVHEFCGPGEYIVRVAEENKASLIVIGTRGMGAIRRTLLGSVSDYVVHHAHCPVLVSRH